MPTAIARPAKPDARWNIIVGPSVMAQKAGAMATPARKTPLGILGIPEGICTSLAAGVDSLGSSATRRRSPLPAADFPDDTRSSVVMEERAARACGRLNRAA